MLRRALQLRQGGPHDRLLRAGRELGDDAGELPVRVPADSSGDHREDAETGEHPPQPASRPSPAGRFGPVVSFMRIDEPVRMRERVGHAIVIGGPDAQLSESSVKSGSWRAVPRLLTRSLSDSRLRSRHDRVGDRVIDSGSWRRTTPSPRRRSHRLNANDTTVGCDLVSAYGLSAGPSQRRDGEVERTARPVSRLDLGRGV